MSTQVTLFHTERHLIDSEYGAVFYREWCEREIVRLTTGGENGDDSLYLAEREEDNGKMAVCIMRREPE